MGFWYFYSVKCPTTKQIMAQLEKYNLKQQFHLVCVDGPMKQSPAQYGITAIPAVYIQTPNGVEIHQGQDAMTYFKQMVQQVQMRQAQAQRPPMQQQAQQQRPQMQQQAQQQRPQMQQQQAQPQMQQQYIPQDEFLSQFQEKVPAYAKVQMEQQINGRQQAVVPGQYNADEFFTEQKPAVSDVNQLF